MRVVQNPPGQHAVVIGAGVAGLATAIFLRRSGRKVTVIDPLGPGGGASSGNAGMVGPETIVPIAMPGMLQQVPKWLTDPLGPLSLRPGYFATALPWFLQWISAGRMSEVRRISDVMRKLHLSTLAQWEELLGADFPRFIRRTGHIHLWDDPVETRSAAIERGLRERQGVEAHILSRDELLERAPGLNMDMVGRALLVPGNGQTIHPMRLMRKLAEILLAEGGVIIQERVVRVLPPGSLALQRETDSELLWRVMTNADNHAAHDVVMAAGATSRELLRPLGLDVPLEHERGYHVMLHGVDGGPTGPILHKSRGFGITQLEGGLRVAGTVEFAGGHTPPNYARAERLLEQARQLFPNLRRGNADPTYWMGSRPSFPDSLPTVGPVRGRPGLWVNFGHSHFGLSGGPPSGRLLSQMMSGQAPFMDAQPLSIERFLS